jgi:hypothetical protein
MFRYVPVAAFAGLLAASVVLAGDLNPPLVGMAEHTDPGKFVSIQLPVNCKSQGPSSSPGSVQVWAVWFQKPKDENPDAMIEVFLMSRWSRLELARWGLNSKLPGTPKEGTDAQGDGWVEEVRKGPQKETQHLARLVEKDGRLYLILVSAHDSIFQYLGGHVRAVLDTFRIVAKQPFASLPAGFTATKTDGVDVWTDSKDKKLVQRVLAAHAAAWKEAAAALPGPPVVADPPLVIVCDEDATYTKYADQAATSNSPTAIYVHECRALAVRAEGKNNARFERDIHIFTGMQYVHAYFGGRVPEWIERGLGLWIAAAAASRGHPEKPSATAIKAAREGMAARKETLLDAFDIDPEKLPPDQVGLFSEASYAWHCFFRFGAGAKDLGERYRKYLDELRRTGSPDEAKKAWDGVDMSQLSTDFAKWAASWH